MRSSRSNFGATRGVVALEEEEISKPACSKSPTKPPKAKKSAKTWPTASKPPKRWKACVSS
jgi:hypothetical protein